MARQLRVAEIVALVNECTTLDDLRVVQGAVRARWSEIQRNAVGQFKAGDRVEWNNSKTGSIMQGTIVKLNIKSVTVRLDNGQKWKVDGSLLREES